MVHGLAIAQNRQCQLFLFEVEHKPLHSKKTNRHFHDDENCTESKKKKKLLNVKELDLVFMVQFTRKKKKRVTTMIRKLTEKKYTTFYLFYNSSFNIPQAGSLYLINQNGQSAR